MTEELVEFVPECPTTYPKRYVRFKRVDFVCVVIPTGQRIKRDISKLTVRQHQFDLSIRQC